MYEEAEKWMKAVGKRKFMGGSAPNLADLVNDSVLMNFRWCFPFGHLSSSTWPLTYNRPSVLFFSGSIWRIKWFGRTRCISRSYDTHNNEAMVWSGQSSRTDTRWSKHFLTSDFGYILYINHEKTPHNGHLNTARSTYQVSLKLTCVVQL